MTDAAPTARDARRACCLLATVALVAGTTHSARAQDPALRDPSDAYRCTVSGALDVGMRHVHTAGSIVVTAMGPVVMPPRDYVNAAGLLAAVLGTCRVLPELELRVEVPVVALSFVAPDGSQRPSMGDALLAAAWVREWPAARLRLGGGVTLPLLSGISAQDTGLALRGGESPWLWVSGGLGFVGLASVETRSLPVYAALDAGGAAIVRVDGGSPSAALGVVTSLAWRPVAEVQLGARFALAYVRVDGPLLLVEDVVASVTPYARVDLGAWFVDAGLTLNVADAYGRLFDAGAVWSVRLAGGGRFDRR